MATLTGYHADAASILESESHSNWIRFFNVRVTPLSDRGIERLAAESIRSGRRIVIANHNMHSAYLSLRDRGMREFYESASYVHIDGMALILLANLLGIRLKRAHRATSLDFIPLLAPTMVRERWRLFYVGSRPGIAEAGARIMCKEYPGLQIRTHHGYLNEEETAEVLQEINDYRPHILMVGMGMPLQERWIQQHRRSVSANVIFPVGAFMDFKAEVIPTPPRWLASFYLEWMYRLFTEPRRLWRRYLVEPWWVLAGLVRYSMTHRGSMTEVTEQTFLEDHVEEASPLSATDVNNLEIDSRKCPVTARPCEESLDERSAAAVRRSEPIVHGAARKAPKSVRAWSGSEQAIALPAEGPKQPHGRECSSAALSTPEARASVAEG